MRRRGCVFDGEADCACDSDTARDRDEETDRACGGETSRDCDSETDRACDGEADKADFACEADRALAETVADTDRRRLDDRAETGLLERLEESEADDIVAKYKTYKTSPVPNPRSEPNSGKDNAIRPQLSNSASDELHSAMKAQYFSL